AETAQQILPLLKQFEETQPYAAWLETRLDYFSVSEKLRRQAARGTTNNIRLPEPSPVVQRKIWVEEIKGHALPPLAFKQVPQLKKIFAAEKVPTELVWVAEVESSFNPKARSPAGAAGLFQLMPATARAQNLSVGLLRDERLDSEKNARAAAQYLRKLHQRFGDWRLALAAYNGGESRVAELLQKQKAKNFDAISGKLPVETRLYVPKVEATLRQREGVDLSALKTPPA
ncbi:MAG: lytic transglycosylase domain-containing protein, partial [Verrucomicrobiota bacterium]